VAHLLEAMSGRPMVVGLEERGMTQMGHRPTHREPVTLGRHGALKAGSMSHRKPHLNSEERPLLI